MVPPIKAKASLSDARLLSRRRKTDADTRRISSLALKVLFVLTCIGLFQRNAFGGTRAEDCNNNDSILCLPFSSSSSTTTQEATVTREFNQLACPDDDKIPGVSASLQSQWDAIDKTISSEQYQKTQVSGGIFLYPRQTSMLIAFVQILAQHHNIGSSKHRNLTVCETGFGSGHSAAMFLEAHPRVALHTFDKFDRPYQLPVVQYLKEQAFPDHAITHYAGDSCAKVREFMDPFSGGVTCDLLHGSSLCKEDNIALVEQSPCGIVLTSTAMNSLLDNAVYFGPKGQWTELSRRGCIRDITCFGEEERQLDRTFVFNKQGATISHKFCIAITTGKCQKQTMGLSQENNSCETSSMAQFTRTKLVLSELCPAYQEPIPYPYNNNNTVPAS